MRRNCCFAGHAQQTPTQQHHAANLPQKTSRNQQSKCMHKALLSIDDQLEDISQFLRFCKAREASIPSLPPRFPLGQKSKLKLAELRLSFDFCPIPVLSQHCAAAYRNGLPCSGDCKPGKMSEQSRKHTAQSGNSIIILFCFS